MVWVKYCSYTSLRLLLSLNPFHSPPPPSPSSYTRTPSEEPRVPGKICSEVLPSINHCSTPQSLPAENRGRNIIPFPFPDPLQLPPPTFLWLFYSTVEWQMRTSSPFYHNLNRSLFHLSHSLCAQIFMVSSVTPQWRQSHAASISLHALFTC